LKPRYESTKKAAKPRKKRRVRVSKFVTALLRVERARGSGIPALLPCPPSSFIYVKLHVNEPAVPATLDLAHYARVFGISSVTASVLARSQRVIGRSIIVKRGGSKPVGVHHLHVLGQQRQQILRVLQ
jgi:hypothetical protein